MSNPENTEPYNGEDFVPSEYTESTTYEHVQHVAAADMANVPDGAPLTELDITALDIDITNTDN